MRTFLKILFITVFVSIKTNIEAQNTFQNIEVLDTLKLPNLEEIIVPPGVDTSQILNSIRYLVVDSNGVVGGVMRTIENALPISGNYWKVNGNHDINPTLFLGPVNEEDLRFRTNNLQQMVLTKNGFLGLGTHSPENKFHIKSDFYMIWDPPVGCPNPPCEIEEQNYINSGLDVVPHPVIRFENIFTWGPTTSYHSKWDIGAGKTFLLIK